jgi:hypothetical protein
MAMLRHNTLYDAGRFAVATETVLDKWWGIHAPVHLSSAAAAGTERRPLASARPVGTATILFTLQRLQQSLWPPSASIYVIVRSAVDSVPHANHRGSSRLPRGVSRSRSPRDGQGRMGALYSLRRLD